MKVLFIGKEKKKGHLSILVERQLNALKAHNNNWTIDKKLCKGGGLKGYLSIYKELKSTLDNNNYDILHAHYSLMGVLTLLASRKEKVIVSFMGSDVYFNSPIFKLARRYVLRKADHIIVKSTKLLEKLNSNNDKLSVIPNGVDLNLFRPMDKLKCQLKLGWSDDKLHILFPSGKDRFEKNYELAEKVISELQRKYRIEFHLLENISPSEVPIYLNAADIVFITSRWEGSSNITKEAMSCNTVVVSTDVGDAHWLFQNTQGFFLSNHTNEGLQSKLKYALNFIQIKKNIQGRQRIIELGLDERTTSMKIHDIYRKVAL